MNEISFLKSVTWDPAILTASLVANLLSLAVPLAMLQIYDRVIPNQAHETLIVLAIMVAVALAVDCALRLARSRLLAFFSAHFEQLAYKRAFWSLIMADPAQHRLADAGTLLKRLSAIDRLRGQRSDGAAAALLDLPFAALFLVVIALLSPIVALSVALTLAISFVMLSFLRKKINAARLSRYDIDARRYSFLSEVLGGIRSVRALQIGDLMARRQERLLSQSAHHTRNMTRSMHQAQGLTAAIGNLIPVVTAATAGFLVVAGDASIGVLAAVVVLSGRIVQPVLRLEGYLSTIESSRCAEADLRALTEVPLRLSGDLPLRQVETLKLRNVTISPEPDTGIAIKNLNISLAAGDCLLLKGDNTAKVALAEWLFRGELPHEQGEIEVNGHPLSAYDLKDRQNRIRLLSKDAKLLEGTLYENICAFQPDLYRENALKLAKDLGLQQVIRHSPRGLHTLVRADGEGLPHSAQRIASNICGLVTLPDVVVFQTANSGLDMETDQRLLNWLKQRAAQQILILITNRPSYMALATQTLDLNSDSASLLEEA